MSISESTIQRLSVYLRCLNQLDEEKVEQVSSLELAERFHLNAAQIRKDLTYFGEFGVRGVGYEVKVLKEHLIRILGLDVEHPVVIIGAGHLGQALAGFKGFNSGGFKVVGLFDVDPQKIGQVTRRGITIQPVDKLKEVVEATEANIGVIAVHPEGAQEVYDKLTATGIRAILNFAPKQIQEKVGVKLIYVDLKIQLETLSYNLKTMGYGKKKKRGG